MINKKIGVTGYGGAVGQELMKYPDVVPLPGDVRDLKAMESSIRAIRPDVIVHLAAISDVDRCENINNKELVIETNVRGTGNVCEAALEYNSKVVLLSTAQVFDGLFGNYKENNKPHPKNFYGLSKWYAEILQNPYDNLKVIRTSYLFDYERMARHIYPLRQKESYEYPTFLKRSFLYLPHFVEDLYRYLMNFDDMPNMLHIAGNDTVSWYEFMRDVANIHGLDDKLIFPRKKDAPGYTPRPYNAGLNISLSKKLGFQAHGYLEGLEAMRELA
jgi:dTDP-4-dehydrorhamnose reductase